MRARRHALLGFMLVLGAACGRPQAAADAALEERAEPAPEAVALADAGGAKSLIHVWKSPT